MWLFLIWVQCTYCNFDLDARRSHRRWRTRPGWRSFLNPSTTWTNIGKTRIARSLHVTAACGDSHLGSLQQATGMTSLCSAICGYFHESLSQLCVENVSGSWIVWILCCRLPDQQFGQVFFASSEFALTFRGYMDGALRSSERAVHLVRSLVCLVTTISASLTNRSSIAKILRSWFFFSTCTCSCQGSRKLHVQCWASVGRCWSR